MSLILGYANKNNDIIMSDGRAGENGSLSEFYNKTRKINDNIIIGFAGFAEPIECFLSHVVAQMGEEITQYYINDFCELMTFLMNDKETQSHLQSSFIILGRDNKNKMYSSIIGNNTHYILKSNQVTTSPRISSIGGTIDSAIIENAYRNNISKTSIPIVNCMITTIHDIAKLDPSVNSNHFYVAI